LELCRRHYVAGVLSLDTSEVTVLSCSSSAIHARKHRHSWRTTRDFTRKYCCRHDVRARG